MPRRTSTRDRNTPRRCSSSTHPDPWTDPIPQTMMDAAKNAVHTFVDTAPTESKVGLTVYGTGTGNDDAEKEAGCRDVQVLHKPGTLDRNALNSAVDGITASGWTPMGPALRQAAAELPDTGPRSIVLVSDGEDTCAPPDACEVARELETQGIDLVLHTIGFAVDDAARTQLTCMAEVTGAHTPMPPTAQHSNEPCRRSPPLHCATTTPQAPRSPAHPPTTTPPSPSRVSTWTRSARRKLATTPSMSPTGPRLTSAAPSRSLACPTSKPPRTRMSSVRGCTAGTVETATSSYSSKWSIRVTVRH